MLVCFKLTWIQLTIVAKLEIHYAAVSIKCLVDTYHVSVIRKYKPMFSAVHELERKA